MSLEPEEGVPRNRRNRNRRKSCQRDAEVQTELEQSGLAHQNDLERTPAVPLEEDVPDFSPRRWKKHHYFEKIMTALFWRCWRSGDSLA